MFFLYSSLKIAEEKKRSKQTEKTASAASSEMAACKAEISHLQSELKSLSESKKIALEESNEKLKILEKQFFDVKSELQLSYNKNSQLTENVKKSLNDRSRLEDL